MRDEAKDPRLTMREEVKDKTTLDTGHLKAIARILWMSRNHNIHDGQELTRVLAELRARGVHEVRTCTGKVIS